MPLFACLTAIVLLFICLPPALRAQAATGGAAPAPDPDLPGAAANFETIPAGSLVIPMDNTLQALNGLPFNMKSYGLVNALLLTNIPMKWAIAAGKAKDGIDFTGTARPILPSSGAAATVSFRSGPFIVHRDFVSRALPIINAFASDVAVYELTSDATVDIRYTLGHKPMVLVLDDGGTDGIHTKILDEAGFKASQYVVVSAANVQTYATNSCYTIVTAPHFKSDAADAETASIRKFLEAGGNLLAQCAAVRTYENNSHAGHFHGSNGLDDDNRGSAFSYPNADLPFGQFHGTLADEGGSLQDWKLGPGGTFVNNAFIQIRNVENTNSMAAAVGKLVRGKTGSLVFYLGGHDYAGSKLENYNGRRMFLNALFVPSDRPTSCGFNFGTDLAISVDDGVIAVQPGQAVTYTIVATNHGPSRVQSATVADLFPPDLLNVSWTSVATGGAVVPDNSGTGNIQQIVDLPVNGAIIYTVQATIGSPLSCTISNRASIAVPPQMTDTRPENNQAFDVDQLSAQVRGPANLEVQCLSEIPAAATNLLQFRAQGGLVPDDCQGAQAAVLHMGDVSNGGAGCIANPLIFTRNYRVVHASGLSTDVTQFITVRDTINPVITCPPDLIVQRLSRAPVPNLELLTASDNCGIPTKRFIGDSRVTNGLVIVITRTYAAIDHCGNMAFCIQRITVDPRFGAPIANPDVYTIVEDNLLTVPPAGVLLNDVDPDGDPLSSILVSGPAHGTLILNSNGSFTYQPNPNFTGVDGFSYNANDGLADSVPVAVTINVTPLNDSPVATPDSATTPEDTAVNINVLANDSDADGDALTIISVTPGGNGTVSINPDGTVRYTPNPNFNGTDTFTYTVNDGNGGTATIGVTVTVNPVNDNPVANPDTATVPEDSSIDIDVLSNDSDPDGDPLTVGSVTQGGHGTVTINPDGTVRYIPNPNFNGSDSFTYTVNDGNGGTTTIGVTVTVGPVNDNPFAQPDLATSPEDTAIDIDVLANDSDPEGDTVSITSVTQGTHGSTSINPGGTVRYIPEPDYTGSDFFSYSISDGNGGTATSLVVITLTPLNDTPIARGDTATTPEDSALLIDVLANDEDIDGDSLSIVSATQPSHGSVNVTADNRVRYIPQPNHTGPDTFTYTISDGNGGTATALVAVVVTPLNDAPSAADDFATTPEDTTINIDVLANDSDVDGDTLTVTSLTPGPNMTVSINPNGTIRFLPAPNRTGTNWFSYTISDGNGAIDAAMVQVVVTAENDAPTAVPDIVTAPEDTLLNINVLANDSDVDGDTLTVSGVTQGSHGSVTINPGGTVRFVPEANFVGTDSFTYSINDGNGGTASASVTITFTPLNDAPSALDDFATTPEDTAININVLANDSDVDGDTITVTSLTPGPDMTVSINPNGTVRFLPAPNRTGTNWFAYTISDGNGAIDAAMVQVVVTAENDAPSALDDFATTPEDTAININVLANDSDVDGDTLTVTTLTPGPDMTVSINPNGTVRFLSAPNRTGTNWFAYTISDGNGAIDAAMVQVVVTAVNDAPTAVPDIVTAPEDTAIDVNVLANDSDVDGDTITVSGVTQGSHGSVTINPGGTVRFVPEANFVGTDSFTYSINDGNGGTASASVTITLTPLNDAPSALDDSATTPEDTAINIDVLANDSDVDGDPLNIESVTQGTSGLVTINPNGTLRYTPTANFNGADTFSYTINDGTGLADSAAVTVFVIEANDPPVAIPDIAGTPRNQSVDIDVLANDMDADNDVLTLMSVTQGSHGTVSILPNGLVRYLPGSGYVGGDSFTYVVVDGNGGSGSTTVTISVFLSNLPPAPEPDTVQGLENTPICIPAATLLGNDLDPNDQTLSVTSVDTNSANGGAVMLVGEIISYTPPAFFTGPDTFNYVVTDEEGASASATVTVQVNPPQLEIQNELRLNRQTSLFEQTVRVTNPVTSTNCGTMTAVRVWIDGLPGGATVRNGSRETNGAWFVQYDLPLEPGEGIDLVIEYHLTNRVDLPVPGYTPNVVVEATDGETEGEQFRVERVTQLANGTMLVVFKAIPGRTYAIQYANDCTTWKTARPYLVATAEIQHWIDSGAPKTESKPESMTMRCYRLILLPTP